jgi:hypothetical protein
MATFRRSSSWCDLRPFHGDYISQICLGPHDVQFNFGKGGNISVWSDWELLDSNGTLLDQATDNQESYKLHVLLMHTVADWKVDAPRSFTLVFENGMRLTIFDDSDQYESFSIHPGGIVVSERKLAIDERTSRPIHK